MRIITKFNGLYMTVAGIELISLFMLYVILFVEGETQGSVFVGILIILIIMVVAAFMPKLIIKSNRATLTVRDGYLEYRQGEYEPELYNINEFKTAHKMEIHTIEKTRTSNGTKTSHSKDLFLLLIDNNNQPFKIPTTYFKEEDLNAILREMVRVNDYLDVNNYKKKKLRGNQVEDSPILNVLLNSLKKDKESF